MTEKELLNIEKQILIDTAPAAKILIDRKEYDYFGGTSYYELHKNDEVLKAATIAQADYGITSSSSRTSYGTNQLLLDVENEAAKFFGAEDAVYLSSGFLTDMAAIQVLLKRNLFDYILIDEVSHYSNQYAALLTGKLIIQFSHLDSIDVERKINKRKGERPLIITDGIFPIYGKIAPLDEYSKIVKEYDGVLWVDDAHGIGIIGENGRGSLEHFNIKSGKCFFGGTLSKAFGGFGGIIPGNRDFVEEIKMGKLHSGTTPPPSSAAAASLTGLQIVRTNPELRLKLWQNAKHLKSSLRSVGIETDDTSIPIVAWKMKSKNDMIKIQNELFNKNILIQFINYVGAGESGALRIVVFSTHTFEQIDNLVNEIKKII